MTHAATLTYALAAILEGKDTVTSVRMLQKEYLEVTASSLEMFRSGDWWLTVMRER